MGGFVSGLAEGQNVRDAVLQGSAAAAMVVARVGCAPAMPSRSELDDFLKAHDGPSAA
jgi:5-dehydro-2-deoxygluconokinase